MKIRLSLSALVILLSFSASLRLLAQPKKGIIFLLKIDNKYPRPTQDTLAKFWLKGDMIKFWLLHKTGVEEEKGDSTGITEHSFTPDSINNDTSKFKDKSHHYEYVRNLKTGEAIDILYRKKEIVVCKRMEKPNTSNDSTDTVWLPEQKSIAGHPCKKMVLVNRLTKIRDTLFAALDIIDFKQPMYPNLKYFPMEYADQMATYTVISVQEGDIPDSEFMVPAGSVVFDNEKDWGNYILKDAVKTPMIK